MREMLISEFKATCIQVLKDVNRTGEPLLVTLRGEPIAQVHPIARAKPKLGQLRGQMEIRGDIVHEDWSDEWDDDDLACDSVV